MKFSEQIEVVLEIFKQTENDNEWYQKSLKDADMIGENCDHAFEGIVDGKFVKIPNAKERNKIATQAQRGRLQRRAAKDNIKIRSSLIALLKTHECKTTINKLQQVLGDTRKIERELENRFYIERKTDSAPENPKLKNNLNKMIRIWKRGNKE